MSETFVVGDVSYDGIIRGMQTKEAIERGYTQNFVAHWSAATIDYEYDELIAKRSWKDGEESLGIINGCLVKIYHSYNDYNLNADVYGHTADAISLVLHDLKISSTQITPPQNSVDVGFWSLGPHGPQCKRRSIEVPTWDAIEGNYADDIAKEIGGLIERGVQDASGKLMLWHGYPGTGKTYAIRSLMRSWMDEFEFDYVVDPERFFGSEPAYMMDVLLRGSDDKWRLVILEDTGELLSADAKARSGQGLSRLLNVVDGLIGQGLRTTILITTNEHISEMHPAVTRPGRCLQQLNFDKLSAREATDWLRANGSDKRTSEEKSLAELYAMLHDREKEKEVVSTGLYI